jgi:nucleoside-diphosphate-sugar epimerase
MALHVIVGAGPVGTATARALIDRGERVRMVTRRGSGPSHAAVERVAADATDAVRLTGLASGAAALYNCANPPYHRWPTDWPPLASALLTAAEGGGATLVTASNLYAYGPVDGPMTEATPLAATHPKLRLRGSMWRDALALHEAGRIRATEVRSSDYLEANSIFAILGPALLAGRRAYVAGPVGVPHSWTSIADVGALLATVATDERAWGRAWHTPTNPPVTIRELATRFTELAGAPAPRLVATPYPVLWSAGLFSPLLRELRTTRYQFTRPFVLDSTAATQTFGRTPRPLDDALRAAIDDLRS